MNTHIYHYCLLQEIKTQNLLQKFTISTYNLPGLTGLPAHHKNPLLTCYLIGFLTYTIRYTIPWTPYSYCFLQSAKPWLQPTLCPQIFFTCMLKLSASSQKALYTTACVLQHTFDTLAMAQCDTEHSHTGHGAVWYRTLPYWPWRSVIQNTPIMAMVQCDTEHPHNGHGAVIQNTPILATVQCDTEHSLHVHTVALPYYKHLHPPLCEPTGSQLPNRWPFPVPRVTGFQVVIVAVLQMMVFMGFHTM